jgi:hypothetical protein
MGNRHRRVEVLHHQVETEAGAERPGEHPAPTRLSLEACSEPKDKPLRARKRASLASVADCSALNRKADTGPAGRQR